VESRYSIAAVIAVTGGLKSKVVNVPSWGGRDDNKAFLIEEWPAARAEKWGMRMFLAIKGTNAHVDEYVARMGMVAVVVRGINSFLAADVDPDKIIPLLDELLTGIKMIRDPQRPEIVTPVLDSDMMEVKTRLWLRAEVLSLHVGFPVADAMSALLDLLKKPLSEASPSP
jgi:hypothetical protein